MKNICLIAIAALLLLSCRNDRQRSSNCDKLFSELDSLPVNIEDYSDTIEIKYAKGLRVEYKADGVHVTISNPTATHASHEETLVVTHPASRFICTTALQLGNFEVLGLEDRIVGINSVKTLFSPTMHKQMTEGQTVKIGKEGNFDLERIIASQPDYIFVSASKHGGFDVLKNCGIPLITHHGYKETDPLGQAEWIKLVGLLTGETRRANAVFADIEKKYLSLLEEVQQRFSDVAELPTVCSGRQIRDGWYVVGGRSYMAKLFHDSGARYVMADNDASGGITLDFEAAFAKNVNADYWQTDGSFPDGFTLETLAEEDKRYAMMEAFKKGHVVFCNLAQTPYRELAGVQPHLLLADFVKAFHPEILPNYKPRYYKLITHENIH